jgi:hypothetical protein
VPVVAAGDAVADGDTAGLGERWLTAEGCWPAAAGTVCAAFIDPKTPTSPPIMSTATAVPNARAHISLA